MLKNLQSCYEVLEILIRIKKDSFLEGYLFIVICFNHVISVIVGLYKLKKLTSQAVIESKDSLIILPFILLQALSKIPFFFNFCLSTIYE